MMMPANFSAVAENEMTYVIGGGIVDVLAPALTESDWQRFNKNLVTIIGNGYVQSFVEGTVGVLFSGAYTPKAGIVAGYVDAVKGIWGDNYDTYDRNTTWAKVKGGVRGVLNVGLNVVGNAAAIYNLATGTAKNYVNETMMSV